MEIIANFEQFSLNENKTVGRVISDWYNSIDSDNPKRERFRQILAEFLKQPTRKRQKRLFSEGDVVLIEYWFKNIITPVRILKREGRKYQISHDIKETEIPNAPNQWIKKPQIIDFYYSRDKDFEKNIDSDIPIDKAVNMIAPFFQLNLYKKLKEELEQVTENNDYPLKAKFKGMLTTVGGFNVFIKSISALGCNVEVSKRVPKDMIWIANCNELTGEQTKKIFDRFKSIEIFSDVIENMESVVFYFGVNCDSYIEYGVLKDSERIKMGQVKFIKSNINSIFKNTNKRIESFKTEFENVNVSTVKLYGQIKKDLSEFSPGFYQEKTSAYINNGLLTQKYLGLGVWDKGIITPSSFKLIKSEFKKFALSKKWKRKVVFSIKANKLWVIIQLKHKGNN